MVRKFGWKPDLPDTRDHMLKLPRYYLGLPRMVDLRPQCPPVVDQLDLGSCTANAIGSAVQFDLMKHMQVTFPPSRLHIYYEERVIEHTIHEDAGAELRNGVKVINKLGAAPEVLWPYDVKKFASKPSKGVVNAAAKTKAVEYERMVPTLNQIKACLASGHPFVFGFSVYESFMTDRVAKTGIMPIPKKSEKMLGGHAVMGVGYDNSKKAVLARNSWGTKWGIEGYFWMPYVCIIDPNMCDDFWKITMMKQ